MSNFFSFPLCVAWYSTKMGEKAVGQKYPSINFSNLFMSPMTGQRLGKLQCILNYFHRIANQGKSISLAASIF
jgi:hypothetical protein